MAGHEFHFLARLDRATREHLELAHTLYRDYDALRFVLEHGVRGDVDLRDFDVSGRDHVALSLADPDEGPFVLVTRTGRFLGCVTTPKSAHGLEVVSRERIDALLDVHAETREPDEDGAESAAGESLDDMFARIFEVGPYLTREEFFALSALTPLVEAQLFYALSSRYVEVATARHQIARLIARVEGVKPREFDRFEAFWNEMWSLAHISVLLASHGGDFLQLHVEAAPVLANALTLPLTTFGTIGLCLRAAWVAAKAGAWLLPSLERAYAEAKDALRLNDAVFGLTAMALRHPRLRADVSTVLATGRATRDTSIDTYASWLVKCAESALDAPEPRACGRAIGAELWRQLTEHLPETSPLRFASEDDVPDDIALPCALLSRADLLVDRKHAGLVLLSLPFVARAEADELFFAEEHIVAIRRPARVDDTIDLLQGWRKLFLNAVAEPKREGPSRQGPCPCGSGKKYKRCCEGRG
ncbi:MAG TPA: SEC-C metal-binding domain-containing protein [Byssovorax sp.]